MKKLPMISLVIAPYALMGFLSYSITHNTNLRVGALFYMAILLFNMVYAFLLPRIGLNETEILLWDMLLKLCHVPIYLLVFAFVLFTHVMSLPFIPILLFFEYSLLLSSSMYGISGISRCRRRKRMSHAAVAVNVFAHFVFCLDVVSGVYCYIKMKKAPQI